MQKLAGFSWRGKRWVDNFGSPADASSSLPPSPFEIIHNDNDGARGNYYKQGSPASPPLIFPSPYSSSPSTISTRLYASRTDKYS